MTELHIIDKLNSAVQCCDLKKIKALVGKRSINHEYDGRTITHLFMENMDTKDIEIVEVYKKLVNKTEYKNSYPAKLFRCMRDVLQSPTDKVNLNILDRTGNTPITILLQKSFDNENLIKKDIFDYFWKREAWINYDKMIEGGDSVREVFEKYSPEIRIPSPLAIACYKGDKNELRSLLKKPSQSRADPLLAIIVQKLCNHGEKQKYYRCLDILLRLKNKSEVMDLELEDNYAAMRAAQNANKKDVVLKLLNVSLYIGLERINAISSREFDNLSVRERFKTFLDQPKFSLQLMNPNIIEEYLDTCLTTKPDYHERHAEFNMKFNYESFNSIGYPEMALFHSMALNTDYEHLLQHPTIHSFIYFRWQQYQRTFYTSLILNTCFFVLAVLYFFFCNGWYSVHWSFSMLIIPFVAMVLLNELYNFQFLLFFMSLVILVMSFFDNSVFPLYKYMIFLSAIGLLLSFEGAPLFALSKWLYFCKRVFINLWKSIAFCAIFIFAFILGLYKNARDMKGKGAHEGDSNKSNSSLDFDPAHVAVLKEIIMSTKEHDSEQTDILPNHIFLGFFIASITTISIVLSNLIVGLAVNDTERMLIRADLEEIIFKVKYMTSKENFANMVEFFLKTKKFKSMVLSSEKISSVLLYPNKSFRKENKRSIGIKMFTNVTNSKTDTKCRNWYATIGRAILFRRSGVGRRPLANQGELETEPFDVHAVECQSAPAKKNEKFVEKKSKDYHLTAELLSIIEKAQKVISKKPKVYAASRIPLNVVEPSKISDTSKVVVVENVTGNWNHLDTDIAILRSSPFKGNEMKFGSYAAYQFPAIAVAAMVVANIVKPNKWKQNTMNCIIFEGIKYYRECMENRVSSSSSNIVFLFPEDLKVETNMLNHRITLSLGEAQHFHSDSSCDKLKSFLRSLEVGEYYCMLVWNKQCYCLMKIDEFYYLFDAYKDGNACIIRFKEPNNVLEWFPHDHLTSEKVLYRVKLNVNKHQNLKFR